MPNYQNSKIYKLTCNDPELVYYGATTKKYLCHRLSGHKYGLDCKSKLLFEAGDVKIELIENFPCNDKNELNAREAFYIRNNKCVNKYIPGRTDKEYREENKEKLLKQIKKLYEENKEKYNEKKREYYEENKEEINRKRNIKIECEECNNLISKRNIAQHMKIHKKQEAIDKLNNLF